MAFVYYQHCGGTPAILPDEKMIELNQEFGFVSVGRQSQVCNQILKKFKRRQTGMENVAERDLFVFEPLQQASYKQAFAGADFASRHDEALAPLYAIDQTSQSFIVKRRAVVEVWIRTDLNRIALEPEEWLVHSFIFSNKQAA